ncbi:MAG TPA: ankyrin repeat domain-containing protein [Thermoanaerobaculia bacterium]
MLTRADLLRIVTLLLPGALFLGCASGAPKGDASTKPTSVPTWTGTATGELTVGAAKVPLRNAYAVVVRPRRVAEDQTRILLTEGPVPLEVLDDLLKKLPVQAFRGVEVVLDARNAPQTVFFHHEEIPAGLEVREVTKYAPSAAPAGRLAGRLTFQDPGFSFGFDVQFDAPVYRPPRKARKSDDPSLTPRDKARAEIDDEGLEFTPDGFRRAVLDDDVETVQLFLDAGMSATTGEPKWSILYDAVEKGDAHIVKALLAAGADANGKDIGGGPLVMMAAADKEPAVLKALLDAGGNPNAKAQMNQTALISAAASGKGENVDVLLAAGANVNARMTTGTTALAMAVYQGQTEIVKRLIAAGADAKRDRKELLRAARKAKNKEIEKALLDAVKTGPKRPKK